MPSADPSEAAPAIVPRGGNCNENLDCGIAVRKNAVLTWPVDGECKQDVTVPGVCQVR